MKTSKWTQSQIKMLLEKTKDGSVRMHAFEEVAKATGRKPNSVRNYYYKLIAEGNHAAHNKQTFAPFNASDTSRLLREIVLGMSRGESVRSVCLKMAAGNKGKMLRLQNKYRAVLAKNPKRIEDTVELLRGQGYLVNSPVKAAAVKNQSAMRSVGCVSRLRMQTKADDNVIFMPEYNNKKLSDLDINNLFMGLVRLIKRSAGEEQTYNLRQQVSYLKAEIESLKKNKGETGNY